MWSMHTPMSPPLVRCPVAKIRTKESALSQSDNLRLKSVCNHEQVRANEGAISQSSLPPLQSVRDDKQEQVRTDKVVVPVSGPLSSDGSMIVIKPLHTLPPFRVDPQRAVAIRAQQNCVRSSVSTQEMDHPVLTIAFPNDEEVEYSSVRPEHFKNAAKEEGRELMIAMVTRIDVIAEDNFNSPKKVLPDWIADASDRKHMPFAFLNLVVCVRVSLLVISLSFSSFFVGLSLSEPDSYVGQASASPAVTSELTRLFITHINRPSDRLGLHP